MAPHTPTGRHDGAPPHRGDANRLGVRFHIRRAASKTTLGKNVHTASAGTGIGVSCGGKLMGLAREPMSLSGLLDSSNLGHGIPTWRTGFPTKGSDGFALRGLFALGEAADDDVEDGGEEESEEGDTEHAPEDGGAEGAAHFCPCSVCEGEGEDAEDEGEGGH